MVSPSFDWRTSGTILFLISALSAFATAQSTNVFGLPANGLVKNNIHLGVLPDWNLENPTDINHAFGAGITIIGDYTNVSPHDYSFSQMDYHLPAVLTVVKGDVKAVYAPAILFNSPLTSWTPAMTTALASKVASINKQGVTVWLRWCFEMNGSWMAYGLQPAEFVQTWIEITNAVRAVTNTTYMLWSPNVWGGAVDDSSQAYTPYWPGQKYVDIAGMSFYSSGIDKSVNDPPSSTLFKSLFSPFYNILNPTSFSSSSSSNPLNLTSAIPVVVSETSAPYYYTLSASSPYYSQGGDTDLTGTLPNISTLTPSVGSSPAPHSDDELYIKASWFIQMTSNVTAALFPNLIGVSWFNHFKTGGSDAAPVLADFRIVGGNSTVEAWFRNEIGNETAYDIGYTGSAAKVALPSLMFSVVVIIISQLL